METYTSLVHEKLFGGCDTMGRLLRGLQDSKGRIAREVHSIRKLGKSLRGGFALLGLGKTSAKEIQAIGRLLAGPRDAVSRLNTWKKLGWSEDATAASAITALLDQHTHSAARKLPSETVAWCLARVNAARTSLEDLPPESLDERIARGLEKLEKRFLKRCRKLSHRREENFHEARKALKAYLGAIGFLPDDVVRRDPKWKDLPDILGDENDLATLSLWLDAHGFTDDFVPSLWLRLKDRQNQLRSNAIAEVSRILSPREP